MYLNHHKHTYEKVKMVLYSNAGTFFTSARFLGTLEVLGYVVMQRRNNMQQPYTASARTCITVWLAQPRGSSFLYPWGSDCGRSTNPTGCHAKNAQPRLYH